MKEKLKQEANSYEERKTDRSHRKTTNTGNDYLKGIDLETSWGGGDTGVDLETTW